jgi:hypothetical protein
MTERDLIALITGPTGTLAVLTIGLIWFAKRDAKREARDDARLERVVTVVEKCTATMERVEAVVGRCTAAQMAAGNDGASFRRVGAGGQ